MIRFLKWVFNFHDQRRQLLLLILIAFLATFFIARFISLRFGPTIFINGYHIHHFYFGMIVLSAGAITGVLSVGKKASRVGSVLIGVGIGLFADEIGLLLNCTTLNRECVYAFPAASDIITTITAIIFLLSILMGLIDDYYLNKAAKEEAEIAEN